ncbi:MAG TPA: type II secretion system protein GspL, partial [Immundisolibacter sp.]
QAPGGPPPPPGLDAQITEVPAEQALCLAVTPTSPELLQGAYAPARPPGQWRPWRPAAVLAGMWLAVLLAGGLLETARLGRQNAALTAALGEQFTRLFPEEGRPVSLRAQAQRRLKLLDRGARGGALPLLAVAARALPPGQTVTALDYKDGALTLELGLPDVAAVEALRTRLVAERAVRADLPMAVAEGGVVRTRLILRPAPGATDVATQEGP